MWWCGVRVDMNSLWKLSSWHECWFYTQGCTQKTGWTVFCSSGPAGKSSSTASQGHPRLSGGEFKMAAKYASPSPVSWAYPSLQWVIAICSVVRQPLNCSMWLPDMVLNMTRTVRLIKTKSPSSQRCPTKLLVSNAHTKMDIMPCQSAECTKRVSLPSFMCLQQTTNEQGCFTVGLTLFTDS